MDEKTSVGPLEITDVMSRTAFQTHEAGKETQSAEKPARQRKDSHKAENAGAVVEERRIDSSDRQWRSAWLPYFATAVAVNLLLWMSMLYSVFRIDDYDTHRNSYIAISAIVFAVPLLAFMFLIWSPYPSRLERGRTKWAKKPASPHYIPVVNMINASLCFAILAAYLYASAIPQYKNLSWEAGFDIVTVLPFPAFAFLVNAAFSIPPSSAAKLETACYLSSPDSVNDCPKSSWNGTPINLESIFLAYYFNTEELPQHLKSELQNIEVSYAIDTPPTPYETAASLVTMYLFDPRLDLIDAYSCGMAYTIAFQAPTAMIVSVTAQRITDTLDLIPGSESSGKCAEIYKSALSQVDSPYLSYTASVSTLVDNTTELCLTPEICISVTGVRFGSNTVQSLTRVHGITKLDILLNAGAIVGAVQFFTWFLGVFSV